MRYYPYIKKPKEYTSITLEEIIDKIRNENKGLVNDYRVFNNEEDKVKLPCVMFGKDINDNPTNYIFLDFDNIEDIEQLKNQLLDLPFIQAFWLSCSGEGIHAIASINEVKNEEHYKAIFNHFNETYFSNSLDTKVRHITAYSFLSYDPNIIVKDEYEPFDGIYIDYNEVRHISRYKFNGESLKGNKDLNIVIQHYGDSIFNQARYPLYNGTIESLTPYMNERIDNKTKVRAIDHTEQYTIIEDGYFFTSLGLNKNMKIREGKRNTILQIMAMKIIFNNPFISNELLIKYLAHINKKYCQVSLDFSEIVKIGNDKLNQFYNCQLDFTPLIKTRGYTLNNRLIETTKEAQKLGTQLYWKLEKKKRLEEIKKYKLNGISDEEISSKMNLSIRTIKNYLKQTNKVMQTTKDKISDTYIYLFLNEKKATQKEISKITGISIATIKRNWKEAKQEAQKGIELMNRLDFQKEELSQLILEMVNN